MKKVMFICSGGGHFSEMKRLAELFSTYNTILLVEKQPFAIDVNIPTYYLPSGSRKRIVHYSFVFFKTIILSIYHFLRFRPAVIVTTGAHTAVPMCFIAKLFKKQIIFIESIARVSSKSLTGKIIEKHCTHILVQWPAMLDVYENATYLGPIL